MGFVSAARVQLDKDLHGASNDDIEMITWITLLEHHIVIIILSQSAAAQQIHGLLATSLFKERERHGKWPDGF